MADFFHRLRWVRGVLAIICILLMGRGMYLSLYQGERLAEKSVAAHVLQANIGCVRGDICDRHGNRITNRASSLYVAVFPSLIDKEETIDYIVQYTEKSRAEIVSACRRREPFCLALTREPNSTMPQGVAFLREKERYDRTRPVVHVLGYTQENGQRGVCGIEAMCDDILASDEQARVQVVIDGAGRVMQGGAWREVCGSADSVRTTLDMALQEKVEQVFDRHAAKGAVVVMTTDGEVLAMVSRPAFSLDRIASDLAREDAPLINRAVTPMAVGSVFKVVTALAGLESGMVRADDTWEDRGRIEVAGITFHGWDDREDYPARCLTLTEAMAYSSNSVLIQIGIEIGAKRIVDMAKRLGYGARTIEGMTEEQVGCLPLPDGLYIGEVANLSIGQGTLLATPMQVAKMMATIANGGYAVEVRLIARQMPKERVRIIEENTVEVVKQMLAKAVDDGTGQAAQRTYGQAAGKTGSAETGRITSDGKSICHAWFSGYFPREAPQYVCTVLVEDGGSGGDVAAPIFREIMEIMR